MSIETAACRKSDHDLRDMGAMELRAFLNPPLSTSKPPVCSIENRAKIMDYCTWMLVLLSYAQGIWTSGKMK